MSDNLSIRDAAGASKVLRATDTSDVYTPHHLEDADQRAALLTALSVLATAGKQDTLIGHVDGVEAALASILAKIIAAPATEAKQDTGNASLGTIAGKDFATQTTLAALLAKVIAAPATEAKQDSLIAKLPASLGAKTGAASLSVVPASDAGLATDAVVGVIGTRSYAAVERVAVSTSSAQSGAQTATEVLLIATQRCFVIAGSSPTAAVASAIPMEAGEKFHMRITSGHKIAVIGESGGGYLYVARVG